MSNFDNLCMNCMNDTHGRDVCPYCGYDNKQIQMTPYLPTKTLLDEHYMIGKSVNKNGEGITYIGYDTLTKEKVFIKEFFPKGLCIRLEGINEVTVINESKELYEECLNSFLKYYRSLVKTKDTKSITEIFNVFKENSTAYAVYEWEQSVSLESFINANDGFLEWNVARPLFMPVLSALSKLHRAGIKHLGISPQNLIITRDGKMKLSGFIFNELRQPNSFLKPELYDGYSALEQYVKIAQTDESTDVYGFTASLFYALSGSPPSNAELRKNDDRLLIPTNILKTIPQNVVSALANGLRVLPNNRTLSFERLRTELAASLSIAHDDISAQQELPKLPVADIKLVPKKNEKEFSNFKWGVVSCLIALVVLVLFGVFWISGERLLKGNNTTSTTSSSETSNTGSSSQTSSSALIDEFIVPNLVGSSYTKVKEGISIKSDYNILLLSEEFDDKVKEGDIISQNPIGGQIAKKNSTIAVTVSKGSKTKTLPGIKGLSLSDASLKISALGLQPVEVKEYSNDYSQGVVIGYDGYNEGDSVERGSQVKIKVSKGKTPTS